MPFNIVLYMTLYRYPSRCTYNNRYPDDSGKLRVGELRPRSGRAFRGGRSRLGPFKLRCMVWLHVASILILILSKVLVYNVNDMALWPAAQSVGGWAGGVTMSCIWHCNGVTTSGAARTALTLRYKFKRDNWRSPNGVSSNGV